MFTVTYRTDSDTFSDNFANEDAAILRNIAARVAMGDQSGIVTDTDGNVVGKFAYHQDEDDRPTVI
jgi:hypothetical protein